MGRNSRKREIGAEVVAKVQSGRTAREVAEEQLRALVIPLFSQSN